MTDNLNTENTVYCVFQDYGSWDDYANNLAGIFLTKEEAEDVKNQLTAELEKFHSDYPRPIRPVYDPESKDTSEGDSIAYIRANEYSRAKDEWHHAVYTSERYEMMRVNHYLVVEKPLNQLFTEYKYFLAS